MISGGLPRLGSLYTFLLSEEVARADCSGTCYAEADEVVLEVGEVVVSEGGAQVERRLSAKMVNQEPPRSPRDEPLITESFHSYTFPPWSKVP